MENLNQLIQFADAGSNPKDFWLNADCTVTAKKSSGIVNLGASLLQGNTKNSEIAEALRNIKSTAKKTNLTVSDNLEQIKKALAVVQSFISNDDPAVSKLLRETTEFIELPAEKKAEHLFKEMFLDRTFQEEHPELAKKMKELNFCSKDMCTLTSTDEQVVIHRDLLTTLSPSLQIQLDPEGPFTDKSDVNLGDMSRKSVTALIYHLYDVPIKMDQDIASDFIMFGQMHGIRSLLNQGIRFLLKESANEATNINQLIIFAQNSLCSELTTACFVAIKENAIDMHDHKDGLTKRTLKELEEFLKPHTEPEDGAGGAGGAGGAATSAIEEAQADEHTAPTTLSNPIKVQISGGVEVEICLTTVSSRIPALAQVLQEMQAISEGKVTGRQMRIQTAEGRVFTVNATFLAARCPEIQNLYSSGDISLKWDQVSGQCFNDFTNLCYNREYPPVNSENLSRWKELFNLVSDLEADTVDTKLYNELSEHFKKQIDSMKDFKLLQPFFALAIELQSEDLFNHIATRAISTTISPAKVRYLGDLMQVINQIPSSDYFTEMRIEGKFDFHSNWSSTLYGKSIPTHTDDLIDYLNKTKALRVVQFTDPHLLGNILIGPRTSLNGTEIHKNLLQYTNPNGGYQSYISRDLLVFSAENYGAHVKKLAPHIKRVTFAPLVNATRKSDTGAGGGGA
jgi:hypothetical protein